MQILLTILLLLAVIFIPYLLGISIDKILRLDSNNPIGSWIFGAIIITFCSCIIPLLCALFTVFYKLAGTILYK